MNIVFGCCATVFSAVMGYLSKFIGTQCIMIFMLMSAFAHSIFIISWTATYSHSYVIFLMAVAFSFSNSLATSQVRGVFGIFFPDNNSAYSAAMIFETFGLMLGSILSIHVCVQVKTYVYMFIIVLSLFTYTLLEIKTVYIASKKEDEMKANILL